MNRALFHEIICCLLVVLFAYAALSKLLDFNTFKFQLGRSPYLTLFPDLIAFTVPIAELLTVGLLIFSRSRLIGLYSSFFLMLLFSGYVYVMLHFSPYLPCSCGGFLAIMSWDQHLVFNIFFTLLALTGILMWPKKKSEPTERAQFNC